MSDQPRLTTELMTGFAAPREPARSRGRRVTQAAKDAIAWGKHPFGAPLANNGKTCGDCEFSASFQRNSMRVWKCLKGDYRSHNADKDLRLSWPACSFYRDAEPPKLAQDLDIGSAVIRDGGSYGVGIGVYVVREYGGQRFLVGDQNCLMVPQQTSLPERRWRRAP